MDPENTKPPPSENGVPSPGSDNSEPGQPAPPAPLPIEPSHAQAELNVSESHAQPAAPTHDRGGIGTSPAGNATPPPSWTLIIERVLATNTIPLTVIIISLCIQLALTFAHHRMKMHDAPPEPPAFADTVPSDSAELRSLMQFGMAFTLSLAFICMFVPSVRDWLRRITPRGIPDLNALDLLATYQVFIGVLKAIVIASLALGILNLSQSDNPTNLSVQAVATDISMLAAVSVAVWLARKRAGDPQGSSGLWPFWTLLRTERLIVKDIVLGAGCYPVFFIVGYGFLVPLGRIFVEYFGQQAHIHPMLKALEGPIDTTQLVIFGISASVGAALFEELIFRGVLYNVLRRYFGAPIGALIAAAIFATFHPVGDWLGIFFLALILTWLYDRTGRLVASMTLHSLNNGIAMALMLYQVAHKGGGATLPK